MHEVERYGLDIVGLTSTHGLASGTSLLERGWTLSKSGVAPGERQQAGLGILASPRPAAGMLGFSQCTRGFGPFASGLGNES